MSSDPPDWTEITTAIVAVIALIISLISLSLSWRGQRLADKQEKRKQPRLIPVLLNGYFQRNPESRTRIYAFYLSVSNPTDSDDSIAAVDLHLTYCTSENLSMTIKLSLDEAVTAGFVRVPALRLAVPAHVNAHTTIAGWCYFLVEAEILNGARVEGHRVVLTDSHQMESGVEPIVVQEYRNET